MAQSYPIVHPIPSVSIPFDHPIGYVAGSSLLMLRELLGAIRQI